MVCVWAKSVECSTKRERENGTRHMTYIKIIVNETTKHDYYGDDDNDNDNADDDDDDDS